MKRLVTLTLALLATVATAALAEEELGKNEYMVACAICHGETARGDGPFAADLKIAVPGLTGLAAKNGGEFPFIKTLMVVDGRSGVRGHGGGAMPIWGDRFEASALPFYGDYGAEAVVRGRLLSLVYYLESIQE